MASITPNSDKRRREEKRNAGRLARSVGNSATARSPQIQRMRHDLQDLIRIAQRTGNKRQVTQLRGILQRILGNVTAKVAHQAMSQALAKSGRLKRVTRRHGSGRDYAKAIKQDMTAAQQLIQSLQAPDAPPPVERKTRPQQQTVQRRSGAPMPSNTELLPSGEIRVKTGSFQRDYKLSDPVITGKWIGVQSSNVRSISFNFNFKQPHKSILYVQFLGTDANGKRAGHGPLYEYYDIHPDKFKAFAKASSKGGWIWDELRVRGSAVQHKVKYGLKGIVEGYVPRRATIRNGREMFVRRTITPRSGLNEPRQKPITSPLPDQDLGPARGRPRRGRPNRGRGPRLF